MLVRLFHHQHTPPLMLVSLIVRLAGLLMLTACAVGEDYLPPPLELPEQWHATAGMSEGASVEEETPPLLPPMPWWLKFQDAELAQLMQRSLANNYDLKIAEARIVEAEANERAAAAGLLPQIDLTGSATRQTVNFIGGHSIEERTQAGGSGSWDIDLFGGARRQGEAAAASVEVAEAERDRVRQTVLAEVARSYVRLRSGQQQFDIILQNLEMQFYTLEVTLEQRREGDVTELEVARAEAQVATTSARLPQIETAIFAALGRLSVLTGESMPVLASRLARPVMAIPSVPPEDITQTPIQTIASRPDVRASERQLAQATALSGEAFAQLFPRLTLTGFFNGQHSNLYAPVSPWSVALNGVFPLLDFGRLRAGVDAADARQQQAFLRYQQTVLMALEETENALTAYMNEYKRMKALAIVAREQAKAAEVAREQYKAGFATQLDLLVAESNRLDAEIASTLSRTTVTENLINLYQTLGRM